MAGQTTNVGGQTVPLVCAVAVAKGLAVVAHTVDGQVTLAGADVGILGVAEEAVAAGAAGPIGKGGIRKVLSGAAVTAGDPLKVNASAKFITWATSGEYVGQALQDAAGADVLIDAWVY